MTVGQQTDQQTVDHVLLTDKHPCDLSPCRVDTRHEPLDLCLVFFDGGQRGSDSSTGVSRDYPNGSSTEQLTPETLFGHFIAL
jgi:hypothetical protein